MKRLLLPFILFLTIPFNTSCIKEITFDVIMKDDSCNCTWDTPIKKAVFGHKYTMKIIPNDGYDMVVKEGELEVWNETFTLTLLGDQLYDQKTHELVIPGDYVNSKITISAKAQMIEI